MKNVQLKKLHSILILSGISWILYSCGGQSPEQELQKLKEEKSAIEKRIAELENGASKPTQDSTKILVGIIVPGKKAFSTTASFQGTVVSEQMVELRPEGGGRVLKISVKEGDAVKQGQTVAVLDGEALKKGIEEAQKALELAVTAYERQKNLWDQKIGSEIQFLQAKNQKEQLEKRIEGLQEQLDKFTLKSPISGTIDKIFLNVGDIAGGILPVLRIVNNNDVKITADISERYVDRFKKGQETDLKFPAVMKQLKGRIRSVGQVIDPTNRTFLVVIDPLGNNKEFLKPNLLADVSINSYLNPEAIVVPANIIRYENDKKFILIVQNNTVKKVQVETGQSNGSDVEILSGLDGSEQVITEGYKNAEPGTVVKVAAKN